MCNRAFKREKWDALSEALPVKKENILELLCKALGRPHLVILRSGKKNSNWNKFGEE